MKRLAAALLLSFLPFAGAEASTAPWKRAEGASMRLIAVGTGIAGRYRAGLELLLEPGVKTYWRTPGEAGVPPLLDWTRSQNLSEAVLRWPVPTSFDDGGSVGFGYKRHVVFPIDIAAKDGQSSVDLKLDFDFALCKDICIPVRTDLELHLDADPSKDGAAAEILREADRHVPRAAEIGGPGPLAIEAAHLDPAATTPVLDVTVRSTSEAPPELFVETPDDWPLAQARRVSSQADRTVLRVPLPHFTGAKGNRLRLTAAADGQGIELEFDPADLPLP